MINKKILAIIPARSGSKGLPSKNIKFCAGKPLISWTIDAALNSKFISKVLVTTDSQSIADIALSYGAWVPFLRDKNLSSDDASVVDVVINVLDNIRDDYIADHVILLQPTSPLRNTSHIDSAINLYLESITDGADSLISVSKVDSKFNWLLGLEKQTGYVYSLFNIDMSNPRRQDLPDCYIPNGSIYIARAKGFNGFYRGNIIPYVMAEESSLDIDYLEDFIKAESALMKLDPKSILNDK